MLKKILNHIAHPKKIYIKFLRLNKKRKESHINIVDLTSYIRHYGLRALLSKMTNVMRGLNEYTYQTPVFTEEVRKNLMRFQKKPLISIIMPVYNVDPKWLGLAIKSVQNQWYQNWELCIADDCSTNTKTKEYLYRIENKQIEIAFLKKNLHISGASNEAIKLAKGQFLLFMDNDDELTVDALYEIVKRINETDDGVDFIYSDEDKIELDGRFSNPHFKPDYSPDMLMSQNYITHLTVIKKELINVIGGFEIGLEGSQDYDLILRATEKTSRIQHIPKILYHWRKIPGSTAMKSSSKNYAYIAGKKALEKKLERKGLKGKVTFTNFPGTYRVKYALRDSPLISIIIPFKDKPELLKKCVYSIIKKSTYQNYEIIGISNNSAEKKTFKTMKVLSNMDPRIRFFQYNVPFNYSHINNYAVQNFAHGEHIILLNNDIEIITEEWIEAMLEFSQRSDVGAVGALLLYPNGKIQQAGIIIGMGGVAANSFNGIHVSNNGYFNRPHIIQNLSAVTGACLMIKKSVYMELGGLNEKELKISYNDVDFCLRIREKGYLNVYTPFAKAYHYESASRWISSTDRTNYKPHFKSKPKLSSENEEKEMKRFQSEQAYLIKRHQKLFQTGDPYYNPNLSLNASDFRLRL